MFSSRQFLIAIILSTVFFYPAVAQNPIFSRSGSPKDKSVEDKYRSDEIERVRRNAVRREERPNRSFPQIKADFERIQVINSDVLQKHSSDRQLDFGAIADAAAEVSKRAVRLKGNLFPSTSKETGGQTKPQTESQPGVMPLLRKLDKAIDSFVHNGMFENIKVVNSEDSTKAQRDLESIMNLSKEIHKRAKRNTN